MKKTLPWNLQAENSSIVKSRAVSLDALRGAYVLAVGWKCGQRLYRSIERLTMLNSSKIQIAGSTAASPAAWGGSSTPSWCQWLLSKHEAFEIDELCKRVSAVRWPLFLPRMWSSSSLMLPWLSESTGYTVLSPFLDAKVRCYREM